MGQFNNKNLIKCKSETELARKLLKRIVEESEVEILLNDFDKIENLFNLKFNRNNNIESELLQKVFCFKRLPIDEYLSIRDILEEVTNKIDKTIRLTELEQKKVNKDYDNYKKDIINLNKTISLKLKNFEDYSMEFKERKNIIINLIPKIAMRDKKCEWYLEILKNEKERVNKVWTEEHIVNKSIYYAMNDVHDNKLFKSIISEIIEEDYKFDINTDYSSTVKIVKELEESKEKFRNLWDNDKKEQANKVIQNMINSDKLDELKIECKDKYLQELKSYIIRNQILVYIKNELKNNYIIKHRNDIINELLCLYEEQKWQLFILVALTQIEGMLYDYCRELELIPDDISKFSMGTKLAELSKINCFSFYEYFKFDLEIIRNKSAHGLIMSEDADLLATELLLDISGLIYDMSNNENLPIVNLRKFLNNYKLAKNKNIEGIKLKELIIFKFIFNIDKYSYSYNFNLEKRMNLIFNPIYYKNLGDLDKELEEVRKIILNEKFYKYIRESKINYFTAPNNNLIKEVKIFLSIIHKINKNNNDENLKKALIEFGKYIKDNY